MLVLLLLFPGSFFPFLLSVSFRFEFLAIESVEAVCARMLPHLFCEASLYLGCEVCFILFLRLTHPLQHLWNQHGSQKQDVAFHRKAAQGPRVAALGYRQVSSLSERVVFGGVFAVSLAALDGVDAVLRMGC